MLVSYFFMKSIFKIYKILEKKEKKYFNIIIALFFFTILLELFSLALIIPLVQIILGQEGSNFSLPFIQYDFSNLHNYKFYILGFFLILYFLKNLFLIGILKFRNNYLYNIQSAISKKLFYSYVSKPYNFFLTKALHLSQI